MLLIAGRGEWEEESEHLANNFPTMCERFFVSHTLVGPLTHIFLRVGPDTNQQSSKRFVFARFLGEKNYLLEVSSEGRTMVGRSSRKVEQDLLDHRSDEN